LEQHSKYARRKISEQVLSERNTQFVHYAQQFAEYLRGQTAVEVTPPSTNDHAALLLSFERLDLALGQIADLASVYGADQRSDIEPLTTPTAVLAGEYLRIGLGACWLEPVFEGDHTLMVVTPDGVALDLDGMARSALMSSQPNLTAIVRRLLTPEPQTG
jgi:hypothetical protein